MLVAAAVAGRGEERAGSNLHDRDGGGCGCGGRSEGVADVGAEGRTLCQAGIPRRM